MLGGPAYHIYSNSAYPADYSGSNTESSWRARDFQWNAGYAWQLKNGKRLLAQAIFNQTLGKHDGTNLLPSAGVYYQTKVGPNSRGMGLLIGLDPRFYFIWGRSYGQTWAQWRTGLDFTLGFGIFEAPVMPQLMYSAKYKNVQVSAMAEYRFFILNTIIGIGDSPEFESLHSRMCVGLVFAVDSYRAK
jgi:hypothetical protein